MTNILLVKSAITGEASVSNKLVDRLVDRLLAADRGTEVVTRDLSQGVPLIDGSWLGAVFTPAESRSGEQSETAALADTYLAEVKAADILVIGLPVYNFGVPGQLKAWFDQLARKGETFHYTENGPVGLLSGKKAYVAYASGGTGFGSDYDYASGYVRQMLGFFGITDVEFAAADQGAIDPAASIAKGEAAVDALAV